MNGADIDRLENLSLGLHGLAGVLAAMSCAFSDGADEPNLEYMRAAVLWMLDHVEQYEKELDEIALRSRKIASA